MSSSTVPLPHERQTISDRRRSVILVFLCTVLGAAAQVFMKIGGMQAHLSGGAGLLGNVLGILTNIPLLAGYALYGVNTVLLMLALRDGELSKLYPIIALTYVWVNILSIFIFEEKVNAWKICGIVCIMVGVTFLGRSDPPAVISTEAGIVQ